MRRRRAGAPKRAWAGERGFSLFEALGALLLAMILVAVLLQALGTVARGTGRAREAVDAALVAQGVVNRLRAAPSLERGELRGQASGFYRWRARAVPAPRRPPVAGSTLVPPRGSTAPVLSLFKVIVDVEAPSGRHVTLESFVAKPTR